MGVLNQVEMEKRVLVRGRISPKWTAPVRLESRVSAEPAILAFVKDAPGDKVPVYFPFVSVVVAPDPSSKRQWARGIPPAAVVTCP